MKRGTSDTGAGSKKQKAAEKVVQTVTDALQAAELDYINSELTAKPFQFTIVASMLRRELEPATPSLAPSSKTLPASYTRFKHFGVHYVRWFLRELDSVFAAEVEKDTSLDQRSGSRILAFALHIVPDTRLPTRYEEMLTSWMTKRLRKWDQAEALQV